MKAVLVLLCALVLASAVKQDASVSQVSVKTIKCQEYNYNEEGVHTCLASLAFSPKELSSLNGKDLVPISFFSETPAFYCYDVSYCNYNGQCSVDHSRCYCNSGYISTPGSFNNTQCNYAQKQQLIAWLLQFFVGVVGAGHFYAGNIGLAVAQLVLCFGGLPLACLLPCILVACDVKEDTSKAFIACIYGLMSCAVGIWWLVDVILFGTNYYKDGNNYPLQSW